MSDLRLHDKICNWVVPAKRGMVTPHPQHLIQGKESRMGGGGG